MSSGTGTISCGELGYCEALMLGAQMVGGLNNTSFLPTPAGTLQSVMDIRNREGAEIEPMEPAGNVRKVRVKRLPRGIDAESQDSITCDITTSAEYVEDCVPLLCEANISFESTLVEMQAYCSSASEVMSITDSPLDGSPMAVLNTSAPSQSFRIFQDHLLKVFSKMNGLRQNVNRQVSSKIIANVGNNISYDTSLPQNLVLLNAVSGAKIEKGIQDMIHDLANNEMYGSPFVIGFGKFDKFNTSAQYGCCNSSGLNWMAMAEGAPYIYYKDVKLGDLYGDSDYFLVLAPGDTQFVYYNDILLHKLRMDQRHGNTVYGIVPDPYVPGLNYDIAYEETNCKNGKRDPSWTISLYLHFDTYITPQIAFKVGDRLHTANGAYNGILNYIATAV